MALLIRADGSEVPMYPAAPNKKWTLKELQAAIGGYIQIVRNGKQRMIVEEDGRLRGRPINLKATEILQEWAMQRRIYTRTVNIVGDVLILGPDERM